MNKSCEKKQQHIVKIFNMWMLCKALKERNTKRLCRIDIRQVTFDTMVMILYRTYNTCSLFAMQLDFAIFKECLNKSRNSHCLYRYQVTLIILDLSLFSNNILKDNKKF